MTSLLDRLRERLPIWDKLDLENEVKVLRENSVYRIGNLYFRKGDRWQQDRNAVLQEKQYKNTILFDYLTNMREEEDLETFKSVVRKHIDTGRYAVASPDELVLHVRLGDMMATEHTLRRDSSHQLYEDLYDKLDLKALPVSRVVLVTALNFCPDEHTGKYYYSDLAKKRSFEILRGIERQTRKAGYSIGIVSNEIVDADICYLASAKFYVPGISTLSKLIEPCLTYNSVALKLENDWINRLDRLRAQLANEDAG